MNDPVKLRQYVRSKLALSPSFAWSEEMIFDRVKDLCAAPLQVHELAPALLWNLKEGYIEQKENKEARLLPTDAPIMLWKITDKGLQREGLL